MGVGKDHHSNDHNTQVSIHSQGFKQGAAGHQLARHQADVRENGGKVINLGRAFAAISIPEIVRQALYVPLVYKVVHNQWDNQIGYTTADSVGNAAQTDGGALGTAPDHQTVADVGAHTAANNHQQAGGPAIIQIVGKVFCMLFAHPADADHGCKIDDHYNDDCC